MPSSSRRDLAAALARTREELLRSRRGIRYLCLENEVLREAAEPLIHQAAAWERFAFVHARRSRFSLNLLCRVLVVDRGNLESIRLSTQPLLLMVLLFVAEQAVCWRSFARQCAGVADF
jgi:hypothetical protein